MQAKTLGEAIDEARRFVELALLARNEHNDKYKADQGYMGPSRATGSARRASMDLTRKLADLRLNR